MKTRARASFRRRIPAAAIVLACTAMLAGRVSEAADLANPTPTSDESFGESFTIIADLDSGAYIQMQMVVSNIGVGDGKGACRFLVVQPDGTTWTESEQFKKDDRRYSGGAEPQLEIGPCTLRAGPKLSIDAPLPSGRVTLTIDGVPSSVHPPNHRIEAKDHFYESEVLIPWARLVAVLEPKGEGARSVRGYGYMDHTRTTALPRELATRWVRFRGLRDEGSLLMLTRFPPDSGVTGWLWDQDAEAPQAVDALEVVELPTVATPDSGEGTTWQVKTRAGGQPITIVTRELLFRHAPVEEQGRFVAGMLRRLIGNPVTYTYRAELRRGSGGAPLRGILEISEIN